MKVHRNDSSLVLVVLSFQDAVHNYIFATGLGETPVPQANVIHPNLNDMITLKVCNKPTARNTKE